MCTRLSATKRVDGFPVVTVLAVASVRVAAA
jgi:hypothetical protein